ncbi:Pol Polyprotein [Phytophthora megakarya]|uniref:Pol Polyprotein n=1 Tax=Phytophthora megakarya TaxID=4795 RepID=A0A225VFQ1_9STRA|nr:Pol Polyprotein [Phytophthora megakarya]
MRLSRSARPYTAFRANNEIYQWLVTPMGLAGMPGTWPRLMQSIFGGKEFQGFVVVYLDDICVFSRFVDEHEGHLRCVLTVLRAEQLYVKREKCRFGQRSVTFLGHVIIDHDKISVISNWPTPQNAKDLQRFIGLAGYFRRFIPCFARLLAPLSDLLKNDAAWLWDNSQARLFNAFEFTLEHKAGYLNVVADALSRPPEAVNGVTFDNLYCSRMDKMLVAGNACFEESMAQQSEVVMTMGPDDSFRRLVLAGYAVDNKCKTLLQLFQKRRKYTDKVYYYDDGLTKKKGDGAIAPILLPLSDAVILRVLKAHHDSAVSAHPGVTRTYLAIRQWFVWDGIRKRIEQYVRTLEDALRCTVSHYGDEWADVRTTVEYAHATSIHSSTKVSPFQLDTGRQPAAPITATDSLSGPHSEFVKRREALLRKAKEHLENAQTRQAKYYNKKRKDVSYAVDDWVYVDAKTLNLNEVGQPDYDATKDPTVNKLLPRWIGPYEVQARIGANAYRVKLPSVLSRRHPVFNIDRLKLSIENPPMFAKRAISKAAPALYDATGHRVYVVERLLQRRTRKRKVQYLVK